MARVGYVVKRYPRFSETFIVNEILAHERAGLPVVIYALRPPADTHFQRELSLVRAPVHYLDVAARASDFWSRAAAGSRRFPRLWDALSSAAALPARDVYQAIHLAELASEHGITHFHAHFATSAADVARLASIMTDIPFTFTAHAKDVFHDDIDQTELELKLRDAAAVVTVSDFNVGFLRDRFGSAARSVRRVYNGLDLDEFAYERPRTRPPLVVAVGRLVEKKGFDVLVEACDILRRSIPEFRCRIIGDGDMRDALVDQIRSRDLGRTVELIGPRPRPDVIAMVQGAAVLAAPCVIGSDGNKDGLPTVLLEAMALGTPCVSTDVTGIPEAIRHGETGLMVAQRDAAALAGALHDLLVDGELRCRLADNARAHVESTFDIATNAAALRSLFRQISLSTDRRHRSNALGKVA